MQPPVAATKLPDFPVPVDRAAVQERDHLTAQMPQQLSEVIHHLDGGRVPGPNLKIQSHSFALRRHAQSSDDREPLAPVTVAQHGRLTHRCPGARHRRNEQEPAFIKEHQMRAPSPGFFLYAASPALSTVGFSWGCVEWLGVRASGNSNPGRSGFSTHAPDDRQFSSVGGFARPRAEWSTSRWNSRRRARPSSTRRSTPVFVWVSSATVGPAWAGASSQSCLCAGTSASSAPASLWRIEPFGPQPDTSDPVSKASPLGCGALPIVGRSLRVSRSQLYHSSGIISIIYASLNNICNVCALRFRARGRKA